jgi:hypothetical protein
LVYCISFRAVDLVQIISVSFIHIIVSQNKIMVSWNFAVECKRFDCLLQRLLQFYILAQSQSHIATDGQSVTEFWCQAQSGVHDQIFITVWQLRSRYCGAPSLARGRVCSLSESLSSQNQSKSHIATDSQSVCLSISLGVEPHLGLCYRSVPASPFHRNGGSSIVVCLFVASVVCLPSSFLAALT